MLGGTFPVGRSGTQGTSWRARRGLVLSAVLIAAAALVAGLFTFGNGMRGLALLSGSVQVAGSETMRPVVTACAEEFMTRHPETDIIVRGGGSGDGIAALLHGVVDLSMMSRDLTEAERAYAASNGIDILVSDLALDGISVIVNRANPVAALDLAQLRSLFAGGIRNWREVGGAEAEILVLARAAGSGTASLFDERIMRGGPYAASARLLPTNEAIVSEVAGRQEAIGYTGLGALRSAGDRVRIIALRVDAQAAPRSPTAEAIRSGDYPFARTLRFGAAGEPSGVVKAFLDFCLGPNGQTLLQKAGYVGIETKSP